MSIFFATKSTRSIPVLIVLVINLFLFCFFYISHKKYILDYPVSNVLFTSITASVYFLSFLAIACSHFYRTITPVFFLLMSIPWLGDSLTRSVVQLVCAYFSICCLKNLRYSSYITWYMLIVSMYLCALLRSLTIDVDPYILYDAIKNSKIELLVHDLHYVFSYSMWNIITFLEIASISFLPMAISSLYSKEELVSGLQKTISLMLLPLSGVSLLQMYTNVEILRLRLTPFWNMQGRISSIYTDPNAFGIMVGLYVLTTMFLKRKNLHFFDLCCVFLFIFFGFYSGSRTLIILLLIGGIYGLYHNRKEFFSRSNFRIFSPVLILLLMICYVVRPPSIDRILYSFSSDHIWSSLNSRLLYLKIAFQTFIDNPVSGVGLGRFYFENEFYAKRAQIDLHSWKDNANNFYAEILCEGGLITFTIFSILFFKIWKTMSIQRTNHAFYFIILLAFSVSLLFGPHLHFIEVKIFLAFVAATISFQSTKKKELSLILFCIVCTVSPFFVKPYREVERNYGLHRNESQQDHTHTQWSGSFGRICIDKEKDIHILTVANHNPINEIELKFNLDPPLIQKLPPGNVHKISLPNKYDYLDFEISPLWRPSEVMKTPDKRLIGLLFSWESENNCI